MNSQRLVFRQAVEALFVNGLSDRMTPTVQAAIEAKGIDVTKLLPGYDHSVWEAAILEAVALFPELSRGDALIELGQRLVRASIEQSPVGASLMPLLKILGTAKAVRRSLKSGASENYNKVTFSNEGSKSIDVSMSDVGTIPEFVCGTQIGLLKGLGAKGARVTVSAYEPPAATFRLEWD
jgi:uncharacterized protein (TIGR02265 family)